MLPVKAFCVNFSRNILNGTGDDRHPCHTPTVVRKKSPTFAFSNTALVTSAYSDFKTCQRPSCQRRSNASRSVKLWKSSLGCSKCFSTNSLKLNICSEVLISDLKPVHSSSKTCSVWFASLLRITRSMTLLEWLIGDQWGLLCRWCSRRSRRNWHPTLVKVHRRPTASQLALC